MGCLILDLRLQVSAIRDGEFDHRHRFPNGLDDARDLLDFLFDMCPVHLLPLHRTWSEI